MAKKSEPIMGKDPRIALIFKGLCDEKSYKAIASELENTTIDQVRRASERFNLKDRVKQAQRQSLDMLQNELTNEMSFQLVDSVALLQPKLLKLGKQVDKILQMESLDDADTVRAFLRMLELHAKVTGADQSSKSETTVNMVYQKVMDMADQQQIVVEDVKEEEIKLLE